MELAEFRRLIYVGITRAIKDIYILGSYNIPKKESDNIFRLFENLITRYYLPDENGKYPFNPEAGFDYLPIEPIDYADLFKTDISSSNSESKLSLDELRTKIIEEAEQSYKTASKIEYECHPVPRSTPSSLEPAFEASIAEDGDSAAKYEQPEDLLTHSGFTAADFGTLVHSYLEMQANGISPEDYEPEPKLLKNLSEKEAEENKNLCIKMCKEFEQSDSGIALSEAKNEGRFYRAEWGFRMFYDGTIFTGSIDLIFQNSDGTYSIVDYKSDNQIMPEKYLEQQKCYKIAASKMLKISEEKISCYLCFLKHNKIVKI